MIGILFSSALFAILAVSGALKFVFTKKEAKKQAKLSNVLSEKVYSLATHTTELKTELRELKDQHRYDIEAIMNRHNAHIESLLAKHDNQIQELQTQTQMMQDEIAKLNKRLDLSDQLLRGSLPASKQNVFSLVRPS